MRELRGEARRLNSAAPGTDAGASLHARADELWREARKLARKSKEGWESARAYQLCALRRRDPSAFYRTHENMADKANPLLHSTATPIPSAAGMAPASERFAAHSRALHAAAPPLDAARFAEFLKLVKGPRAGDPLSTDAPFTRPEMKRLVFPQTFPRGPPPAPCRPACPICVEHNAKVEAARMANEPCPQFAPAAKSAVAGGPDQLISEFFRWARPEDESQLEHFRDRVCDLLVQIFNKALIDGDDFAGVANAVILPLFKDAKMGAASPDRADPASYRPLAIMDFLLKVLSLALLVRIEHWAAFHGHLPDAQCGFRKQASADHNVFTLTQLIKGRLRQGQPTALLLVDFKSAYDRVDLPLLWLVLEKMGLPVATRRLLLLWSQSRSACVRVNGSLSEAFPVSRGIPQGDPLSPILFSLFIASLSAYLESCPDVPGADFAGVIIRHLLYADDLAVPTPSPAACQAALNRVQAWCSAWGMEMNTSQNKTECMLFTSLKPRDNPPGAPAPLTCGPGGRPVHWVAEYVYLGYLLNTRLDDSVAIANMAKGIKFNLTRLFVCNKFLRCSPMVPKLQISKSHVIGASGHNRSTLQLNLTQHRELDILILKVARCILRLPKGSSNALVWSASTLVSSSALSLQAQYRMACQLELHPNPQHPAARLYRALLGEQCSPKSLNGKLANWAHVLRRRLDSMEPKPCDVPGAFPTHHRDCKAAAKVLARAYMYVALRDDLRANFPRQPGIPLPPPSNGSLKHGAAMCFWMSDEHAALGLRPSSTPVSLVAPRSSGSLLAQDDSGFYPAVTSAWCGAEAMHRWPFAPKARRPGPGSSAALYRTRFDPRSCRLCGSAAEEDVFHLACACTHPALAPAQQLIRDSAPQMADGIWRACLRARNVSRLPALALLSAERDAFTAFTGGEWPTSVRERNFLSYWLLLATPWPHDVVAAEGFHAAAALGAAFDATNVSAAALRALAASWLSWSEEMLARVLGPAWQAACAAAAAGPR